MQGRWLTRARVGALGLGSVLALAAPRLLLAGSALAQPSPAAPTVIDGPSPAIQSLGGMSIARDGTGGLVYVKTVGGIAHVFVSALIGGQFQPPQQVDAPLAGASSQPVIAAGNGGVLLIAFINGGALYVVDRASTTAPYGSPAVLATGASNPSIGMTNFGKAYIAFTAADGAGFDVRAAYYYNGAWALEPAPLNATPADDAGTGSGRPDVAAAGDGVAIVVWGEGGHVYSRRVWGTAPSVVDEQADVPSVSGCGEVSAGEPSVSSGGDSSYADVAFTEVVSCGGAQQSRVLVNRLHGSQYDGITAADALSSPGTQSGGDPQVAMTEYGQGFVTAAQTTNAVIAMELGDNGAYGPLVQVNSVEGASPAFPVPGIAGLFSTLVAWQQNPGTAGPAEIRVRYQPRASGLGPELVVSSPAAGPADAALGIAAAGDVGGDAAIAWVQGTGGANQIVVSQLYQPPGALAPAKSLTYARTPHPLLSWSPAAGRWGPDRYALSVDGAQVAQTTGTSDRVPVALTDGSHAWQVTAINPAGVSSTSQVARVFVDTVAPLLKVTASGVRRIGSPIALRLRYRDAPAAGMPPKDASGVAELTIRWGDGTVAALKPGVHRSVHAYRRAGRYKVTVVVEDRAQNKTTVVLHLSIAKVGAPSR